MSSYPYLGSLDGYDPAHEDARYLLLKAIDCVAGTAKRCLAEYVLNIGPKH